MKFKTRLALWLLKNKRDLYKKMKGISYLDIGTDEQFLDLHAEMIAEERGIQSLRERWNLYTFLKNTTHLEGSVAEVGVYRGGSAKILCKAKGNSPLYLFDTFEGLPPHVSGSEGVFSTGDFNDTCIEDVSTYLASFEKVHIIKGYFPESTINTPIEHERFRFAHLDVDISESTYSALDFFYPRMLKSGIIISHDYRSVSAPGVKKAFDQFFQNKPETVIPIWDSQCLIVKL
ncbi:MAG: TylF/MycF/NovP-related O-methyltransferase [Terrimicrobiaceae bacterium]